MNSQLFYQILRWSVLVRVDGLTYSFLGTVVPKILNGTVNLTSLTVAPTQTVLTGQAEPMQVNLTFLNPFEVRFFTFLLLSMSTSISS